MLCLIKMSLNHSLSIIPDDESEEFTTSTCNCSQCQQTHLAQSDWDTFTAKTNLQRGMKDVIARIEKREKDREKDDK